MATWVNVTIQQYTKTHYDSFLQRRSLSSVQAVRIFHQANDAETNMFLSMRSTGAGNPQLHKQEFD